MVVTFLFFALSTMQETDPTGNGHNDSAPSIQARNDGKQWAQDLVLEEIGLKSCNKRASPGRCVSGSG
jgi:hypothetical protein